MAIRAANALTLLLAALAPGSAAAQGLPTLRYDPPPNFYYSAITPPDQFTSNEVNASLQIYPFRPFSGDIQQMFAQTLLREWIDPQYQEANLAAAPMLTRQTIPGADMVLAARFAENGGGTLKQHMRLVIVAGQAAAIVDASAYSPESWQRILPALNAMAASWQVVAGPPPLSAAGPPSAAAQALAGVYMGFKGHYVVDLNRPVGYGNYERARHYYLFSPDGRVYRGFDLLVTQSSDLGRFDFDQAERNEPESTGRYAVQSGQLVMQFGGPQPETITTALPQGGRNILRIDSVDYERQ